MKFKYRIPADRWYFTSDLHLFHNNIVEICNRRCINLNSSIKLYDDITDQMLIDNWNSKVPEDGYVVIAGDFMLTSNQDKIRDILDKLNGTKILVLGNHCQQNGFERKNVIDLFDSHVYDSLDLTVYDEELDEKVRFYIQHYPCIHWTRGAYHLHGHIHSKNGSQDHGKVPFHPMRYDIGVDNNYYMPVSYQELKLIFAKQELKGMHNE